MAPQEERTVINADDVIARLRAFPNPHAIWAAFRMRMIDEKTVFELLPDPKRDPNVIREISNFLHKIWNLVSSATRK